MKITLNDGRTYNRYVSIEPLDLNLGRRLLDLQLIANSVFLIEGEIHANKRIKEVEIPLFESYSEEVNRNIQEMMEFLFEKSIGIKFSNKGIQKRINYGTDEFSGGHTCLFSGGMDSFSGILNARTKYRDVSGVFTNYTDQRNMKRFIKNLEIKVLNKHGIGVTIVPSEKHGKYFRLARGFLCISNGLLLRNPNIIIAEVGPTMFQPKFALLDEITFTTHPKILALTKKVADGVLGTKIKLIKPNENLTKAEVASVCPEKRYIPITCSCLTSKFCNSKKPHEGGCYGCIIRRLALLVAGIKDSEYRSDILTKEKNKIERYDNVLHLFKFALDVLTDFDSMEPYTKSIITHYRKRELFERFALDVFAGLYILKKKGKLKDKNFIRFLERGLQIASIEKLQNRIGEVRDGKFKPDFSNSI